MKSIEELMASNNIDIRSLSADGGGRQTEGGRAEQKGSDRMAFAAFTIGFFAGIATMLAGIVLARF